MGTLTPHAIEQTGKVWPLTAEPWLVREEIAPRLRQEAGGARWTESNGSAGCYGGWELRCSLPAGQSQAYQVALSADATSLERGADELLVELFWEDAAGQEVGWEPLLPTAAEPFMPDWRRLIFGNAVPCPPAATTLRVRHGLRWSPRGRVRWHGWSATPVAAAPAHPMRLGVASGMPAAGLSLEAALAHYVQQADQAGLAGVDLVCLPETILSWRAPRHVPATLPELAVPVPGPWLEPLAAVARRYRMGICCSVYERDHELVYNTAVLLGRAGELIGTYRKVHLAVAEARQGVTPGTTFPVYRFDGATVGMLICMDSAAAETTRVLAAQGAEVVLMPIMGDFRATPWRYRDAPLDQERWRLVQRAHAFENHVYFVSARNANLGSAITAPWGDILAYNGGDRDLIWADVDLNDRRSHHMGSTIQNVMRWMRRPVTYGGLSAELHV